MTGRYRSRQKVYSLPWIVTGSLITLSRLREQKKQASRDGQFTRASLPFLSTIDKIFLTIPLLVVYDDNDILMQKISSRIYFYNQFRTDI